MKSIFWITWTMWSRERELWFWKQKQSSYLLIQERMPQDIIICDLWGVQQYDQCLTTADRVLWPSAFDELCSFPGAIFHCRIAAASQNFALKKSYWMSCWETWFLFSVLLPTYSGFIQIPSIFWPFSKSGQSHLLSVFHLGMFIS